MKHLTFPSSVYADALPTGEFVTMKMEGGTATGLLTHLGSIPLPAKTLLHPGVRLLFNRITNVGGFKIASKAHEGDWTYIYENGQWREDPRGSHGVQGHIWHPVTGELVVMQGMADQESQGFRYYSPEDAPFGNLDITGATRNEFVTGSPSYNPFSPLAQRLGVRGIYEWTRVRNVIVGQGEFGGTLIQYNGKHKLLIDGDCRFIQMKEVNGIFAIAVTRLRENDTHLFWLTEAEIAALPDYEFPKPEPTPTPEPEPMPSIPNHIETVRQVRAKYGDRPSDIELGLMLNEIAWIHRDEGFGLSTKRSGTRVPSPQGIDIAHDVLHKMPEDVIVDVFIAAGAEAIPTWNIVEHHRDPSRPWLAPIKPAEAEPEPEPEPVPVECKCAEMEERLEALESRIAALESKPEPEFTLVSDESAPEFSTGRSLVHTHNFRLKVVRKQ